MAKMSNRDATKMAQAILAQAKPEMKQDGWWGGYTNGVFVSTTPEVQSAVRLVLRTAGTSPEQLMTESVVIKTKAVSTSGGGWLPEDYVYSVIDRVAAQTGLDSNLLRRFVRIEAAQRVEGGVRMYNAGSTSPNGLYRGLFQMGAPAWSDVEKAVGHSYSSVMDPVINTIAAAQYIKLNMRYARDKGYKGEFTPEVLYTMHNQGAGGFMRLLRERRVNSNFTNQSKVAQDLMASALSQNGVKLA